MVHAGLAAHRTIVVVDMDGFGDQRRNNANQIAVRDGLYRSLRSAFGVANVSWDKCEHEDRGDGVFVLAGSEVPKAPFVEVLPQVLVKEFEIGQDPVRQQRAIAQVADKLGINWETLRNWLAQAENRQWSVVERLGDRRAAHRRVGAGES